MEKPPGLYLRRFALRHVVAILALCVGVFVLSWETRRPGNPWRPAGLLVLELGCFYWGFRLFRRADRIADGFVGETKIARALRPLESDGYLILGPRRWSRRRGDIDQIVVGPTGVFAIEIKAWKGRIDWRRDRLIVSGWDRTREVRKASAHAIRVKERIPKELGVDWVEAVTVFADQFPPVGCRNRKSYWTVPAEDLPGFIRSRSKRLTAEECAFIASALN